MSWFSTAWDELLALLAKVGSGTLSFLAAVGQSIAQNGGPVLIKAAEDGVLAAETAGGDGATKKAAAFAAVIADLKAQGVPVVVNAVNAAIEGAVANMKAAQVSAATPTPVAIPQAPPANASSP